MLWSAVVTVTLSAALTDFSAPANASSSPGDRAALQLQQSGVVPVQSVGPYVERGTYRVQVSAKLGSPDAVLADGTWVYYRRAIDDSEAEGSLIVRFVRDRVSDLVLVNKPVLLALRSNPTTPLPTVLLTKD